MTSDVDGRPLTQLKTMKYMEGLIFVESQAELKANQVHKHEREKTD